MRKVVARFDDVAVLALEPRYEWVRVFLCAPVLLFPRSVPTVTLLALTLIASLWIVQFARGKWKLPWTPLTLPMTIVVVMALASTWRSPLPDVSLPRVVGIFLGLLIYRAVVLFVTDERTLWKAVYAYIVLGGIAVALGTVSVAWRIGDDINVVARLTRHIPQLISGLPGTERAGGVNPNALGGTTLFFLPLAITLTASRWRNHESWVSPSGAASRSGNGKAIGVATDALTLVFVMALLLSQSRIGWIAAGVAGGLLTLFRIRRRVPWAVLMATGAAGAGASVLFLVSVAQGGFYGRKEIWADAVALIGQAPLVGPGLGVFRYVAQVSPLTFSSALDWRGFIAVDRVHAHNIFLQTALDIGLPGLIAYLSLLVLAAMMCWRIRRAVTGRERALCLGLIASLAAVHIFGLADAIALGAKVSLFLWFNLGLITAAHQLAMRDRRSPSPQLDVVSLH